MDQGRDVRELRGALSSTRVAAEPSPLICKLLSEGSGPLNANVSPTSNQGGS